MNDVTEMPRAGYVSKGGARPPDDERQKIFDELGDLSTIRLPLNQILLAIWKAPEITRGGIIRPSVVRDEDIYQGIAALVVKLGPHCYEQTGNMDFTWLPEDVCNVGDWVMFRRGEGFRVNVNGRECMLMNGERGIKMVLRSPDVVL